MPEDQFEDTEKLLAAMDFAAMTAAQEEKQRKEMTDLLQGFLEVVDSLQALEAHCRELNDGGQTRIPLRSVSVTVRQALQVLAKSGVAPMNAAGGKLDLDLHEVVAVSQTSRAEADSVIEEAAPGYLWNGRLLRRAKVVVSSGDVHRRETAD